jgi:hypothetical protein
MAVVIGSQTFVSLTIPMTNGSDWTDFCVVSINWSYTPNIQRYYCLGQVAPAFTISKPSESLSVAVYTPYIGVELPGAGFYDVTPSEDCEDQDNKITVVVDPGICDEWSADFKGPISTTWYLNNYGFSKDDPNLPGQETWALTAYPTVDLDGVSTSAVAPDSVVRGIAEGQATVLFDAPYHDADPGVVFDTEGQIKASTGNVQAGQQGRIDYQIYGTASAVGGSSNKPSQEVQFGRTGNGSVSVQQQPVWY